MPIPGGAIISARIAIILLSAHRDAHCPELKEGPREESGAILSFKSSIPARNSRQRLPTE